MRISVKFPEFEAVNDDERSRVHTSGEHKGCFFNSYDFWETPTTKDGEDDFTEHYVEGFKRLYEVEPRVVQGRQYSIEVL